MPQTATKQVLFHARRSDLQLVVQNETERHLPDGRAVPDLPEIIIEFENGTYQTDDPDELAFLRQHPLYQAGDGFHEVGAEPDRVPDPSPILGEITALAVDQDADQIRALLTAEQEGYGRPEVVSACEAALGRLQGES